MGLEMMNTLRVLTQQDSKFVGGVGQNTLEQIAVEGVGQNTLRLIGGSWSCKGVSDNTQSNCSNLFYAFLTNSLHCILDQLPP